MLKPGRLHVGTWLHRRQNFSSTNMVSVRIHLTSSCLPRCCRLYSTHPANLRAVSARDISSQQAGGAQGTICNQYNSFISSCVCGYIAVMHSCWLTLRAPSCTHLMSSTL